MSFLVLEKDKDNALQLLQELGVIHLVNLPEKSKFSSFAISHETEKLDNITSSITRINKILELFQSVEKEKGSLYQLKQLIKGKEESAKLFSQDLKENLAHTMEILEKTEAPCTELAEKLKSLTGEEGKIKERLSLLKKVKDFSFDLSQLGDSRYLTLVLGELPQSNFSQLQKELPVTTEILQKKEQLEEENFILLLLSLKSKQFYDTLRENYFDFFELGGEKGIPLKAIKSYEQRLFQIKEEKKKLSSAVAKISHQWKDELKSSLLSLENYKEREEVISKFVKTKTTYLLQGFVPLPKVGLLSTKLKDYNYCELVEVKDPEKGEEVPTLLHNHRIVRPFELITNLYGLPQYNEIDPTLLIFLVFPLFFGICLTDAGYGLVVLLASVFLYWLYRHQESGLRDFSYILIISALFTIVLGIVTGGIFGPLTLGGKPANNMFYGLLMNYKFNLPILLDLFDRAKIALGLALGLGWFHLLLGFGIKAFSKYKAGDSRGMVENINWASLEFILGLGTLLLLQYFTLPQPFLYLILAIFAINLVGVIILSGPMGIMDISGTFGSILSYARLFALAMATASIALAVNIMAGELSKIEILGLGVILSPLFLIIGQLFSLVINTMGAVIHPLRLHYVEFFSRFYEGGGIKYSPFRFKQKT